MRPTSPSSLFLFLAALAPACVYAPLNDTDLPSKSSSIGITGATTVARQWVYISAAPDPQGPYTQLTRAVTDTSPYAVGGTNAYFYRATVRIGDALWSGNGCRGYTTYLRATSLEAPKRRGGRPVAVAHATFDSLAPNGQPYVDCLISRAGQSALSAVEACKSPESGRIRLRVPGTGGVFEHSGDITIASLTDSANWSCLERIDGNLTVTADLMNDMALPNLISVSGNVTLNFDRANADPKKIELPALTTIGGNLLISTTGPSPLISLDMGLEMLSSLGGDLTIDSDAFNTQLTGLGRLTYIPGDFASETGNGDTTMEDALENLQHIGGDFSMSFGFNGIGIFPALETVGGDFSHLRGDFSLDSPTRFGYGSLRAVGGDFLVSSCTPNFGPAEVLFPSLESAGGTLTYRRIQGPGTARSTLLLGAPNLSVGGLSVDDNAQLTNVSASNIAINPGGSISFTHNSNLCTSSVQSFVNAQAGPLGTVTLSGNNGGC